MKAYKSHLSSAYWKALRKRVWERMVIQASVVFNGDPMCECGCGQTMMSISEMQLGHLTYARFGRELDSDVIGITKACNMKERASRAWYKGRIAS